jgi:hypothetical protein
VVPDNPKTAVIRPCRYESALHRSYQEMAAHYGTVIAGPSKEASRPSQSGYHLVHQNLEVRLTAKTVKLSAQGKRVAAHVSSYLSGKFTTLSGALTCIVREVVGWLGPAGGVSALEGQNRAQSIALAASNLVAAAQKVAPAVPAQATRPNRGPFSPAEPEMPSSTPQSNYRPEAGLTATPV